jgi:hypothetical protein
VFPARGWPPSPPSSGCRCSTRSARIATGLITADARNQRCHPFSWTKDADELIAENQTVGIATHSKRPYDYPR